MAYGPPTATDPTNVMGRRIAAWFIDVIVPTVVAFILGYIVFIGAATKITGVPSDYCEFEQRASNTACVQLGDDAYIGTDDDVRAAVVVGGLVFLVGALNLFVVQGLTGAAVGKHMLGLRVVRQDGSIAKFGPNAARTLLLVVDHFFCYLVGLITALVTHPHRRVGDMAAGTFVVAKDSVGLPIGSPVGAAYPQSWTPPSPGTGWGPPPAGGTQTWGPPPAAEPGWPRRAEAAPPASTAPPTWGTPAATPPPAETPSTWGTPAPSPTPAPTPAATPTPEAAAPSPAPEEAPGWASPSPAPTTDPAPAPTAAQPGGAPAPSREPQWDSQRDAWVYWEAETSRWLQFDAATGQWGPLR
jgi:uncharacterized RDD family membrane protein YckC